MKTPALLLIGLLCAQGAHAMCYSMFDRGNRLVYQSPEPPIDMSYAISDEVQRRFPGHHLVVVISGACEVFNGLPVASRQAAYDGGQRSPSASPALTLGRSVGVATQDVDKAIASLESAPPSAGYRAPAVRPAAVRKPVARVTSGDVLRVKPKLKTDLTP